MKELTRRNIWPDSIVRKPSGCWLRLVAKGFTTPCIITLLYDPWPALNWQWMS